MKNHKYDTSKYIKIPSITNRLLVCYDYLNDEIIIVALALGIIYKDPIIGDYVLCYNGNDFNPIRAIILGELD